jgi:hypothetical protein
VSGPVAAQTDEAGRAVPRENAVRFHFMVVQDGHVVRGESVSDGARWSGTTGAAEGLSPGPAIALGLAVEAKTTPAATFETASWVEAITLKGAG